MDGLFAHPASWRQTCPQLWFLDRRFGAPVGHMEMVSGGICGLGDHFTVRSDEPKSRDEPAVGLSAKPRCRAAENESCVTTAPSEGASQMGVTEDLDSTVSLLVRCPAPRIPRANGDASRDDARAVDSVLMTRRNRTPTAGKGGNHGD